MRCTAFIIALLYILFKNFVYLCFLFFLSVRGAHLCQGFHQAGNSLDLGGDDDLGGLSVSRLLKRLQALDGEDRLVSAGLLQEPDTVSISLLYFCLLYTSDAADD